MGDKKHSDEQCNNNRLDSGTYTGVNAGQVNSIKDAMDEEGDPTVRLVESIEPDGNEQFTPPDGGARAWLVMIGSFLCNGILFGVINTYGVIFPYLLNVLQQEGVKDASAKASLVGALTIGTTFFFSSVAGILTDKFGIRRTTFAGGAIAASGMLISSFVANNVEALYVTYGLIFGIGASLAYTPSLVILGHYFKRYLGVVNGFVTAGSSVFTIVMPYILDGLLRVLGFVQCLRFMACLMAVIMGCALLFKPLVPPAKPRSHPVSNKKCSNSVNCRGKCYWFLSQIINFEIWKKKKYVIWTFAIPSALFGYFVPYVHIVKFVENYFPDSDGKLLVLCIGITSGLGRLIFGKIADIPKVDRILLQQISFVSIGILTMLLTAANHFVYLILISLGMGLFDGCFISLLGPIAFEICGQSGASQAIGFLLALCSIPLTVGPPVAGILYDKTGSYQTAFIIAGIPPIIGAFIMWFVKRVKDDEVINGDASTQPLNVPENADAGNVAIVNEFSRMGATKLPNDYSSVNQEQKLMTKHSSSCMNISMHNSPETERLLAGIRPTKSFVNLHM